MLVSCIPGQGSRGRRGERGQDTGTNGSWAREEVRVVGIATLLEGRLESGKPIRPTERAGELCGGALQ
eukprot:GDKH01005371.1.p3 GENE.GDKH01005371.1~~GDKH01005371.1.p3  ORF type:complete len:68 (-),score=7.66 GDKH01005371.1:330-533(-)